MNLKKIPQTYDDGTRTFVPAAVSLTSSLTVTLDPPILAALQYCWQMGTHTAAPPRSKKRAKSLKNNVETENSVPEPGKDGIRK